MKRLIVLFISILSLSVCKATDGVELVFNPDGKWISTIPMTKIAPEYVDCTYTFVGDSLYIDVYPSGCNLAAMSIRNVVEIADGFKCEAIDTLYDIFKGIKIHEKLYNLEFKKEKLPNGNTIYKVYRDTILVDKIKKFP